MKTAIVSAPGKINLTLDVLGRREDGYHEVDMLMHAVSLENTIQMNETASDGIRIRCSNPLVPTDGKNLASKAAEAFFKACGRRIGLDIFVEKRVPMEAGMAGGSADAAGVLAGLNGMMDTGFSLEELCQIALPLGADIPFCLMGGAARVQGIGEKILPLPPLKEPWLVIVKPSESMKTADCYAAYDRLLQVRHPDTDTAMAAMEGQDLTALGSLLENVLEQAAALPVVDTLRQAMLKNGALGSRMTGSGTAVFGLFPDKRQALRCARRMYQLGGSVFLARPVPYGANLLYLD